MTSGTWQQTCAPTSHGTCSAYRVPIAARSSCEHWLIKRPDTAALITFANLCATRGQWHPADMRATETSNFTARSPEGLKDMIRYLCERLSSGDSRMPINKGHLNSHIMSNQPDFDTRTYGCRSFNDFLCMTGWFTIIDQNNVVWREDDGPAAASSREAKSAASYSPGTPHGLNVLHDASRADAPVPPMTSSAATQVGRVSMLQSHIPLERSFQRGRPLELAMNDSAFPYRRFHESKWNEDSHANGPFNQSDAARTSRRKKSGTASLQQWGKRHDWPSSPIRKISAPAAQPSCNMYSRFPHGRIREGAPHKQANLRTGSPRRSPFVPRQQKSSSYTTNVDHPATLQSQSGPGPAHGHSLPVTVKGISLQETNGYANEGAHSDDTRIAQEDGAYNSVDVHSTDGMEQASHEAEPFAPGYEEVPSVQQLQHGRVQVNSNSHSYLDHAQRGMHGREHAGRFRTSAGEHDADADVAEGYDSFGHVGEPLHNQSVRGWNHLHSSRSSSPFRLMPNSGGLFEQGGKFASEETDKACAHEDVDSDQSNQCSHMAA
jgi:hypothetical protein